MKKLLSLIAFVSMVLTSFAQGKDADDAMTRVPINPNAGMNSQPRFADSYPPSAHEIWQSAKEGDFFIFNSPVALLGQNNQNYFCPTTNQTFEAFVLLNGSVKKVNVILKGEAIPINMISLFYLSQLSNGAWVYDKNTNISIYKYFYPVKLTGMEAYMDPESAEPFFVKRL